MEKTYNLPIIMNKPIQVEIVEEKQDGIIVRLPFLEIPIEMNWAFFYKRVEAGYFTFRQAEQLPNSFSLKLFPLSKQDMK